MNLGYVDDMDDPVVVMMNEDNSDLAPRHSCRFQLCIFCR